MKTAIIIGAGASGAAAALRLRALCPACKIILLEKNERILKKLLTTGNGRCNITNTAVSPAQYPAFARPVMSTFDFESVRDFLRSISLPIKEDTAGRCYPLSESANNAVNLFLEALRAADIEIRTGAAVSAIRKQNGKFLITANERYEADAVIFAPGSAASVNGYNGWQLLQSMGITPPPPSPALCPIPSKEPILKSLKGVRVKGKITLEDKSESGEIQLNENNISGICAFNLSKYAYDGCIISLDFCNGVMDENTLLQTLRERTQCVNENAALLDFLLLRKLGLAVLKRAGIKPSGNPKQLEDTQLKSIIKQITRFTLKADKPTDFSRAQTVCGGAGSKYVSSETLESKDYKGLFFCGEILDADAPCGGFNLHWAWASGLCAAQSASRYLGNGE
ncbi:MAG: aminoacetone oxidase family FAD-binding enzyme [Clostridia bacterium]|nr:aminoacetone oxidase family FAD-binding enzyme [Clostridia bacterium]